MQAFNGRFFSDDVSRDTDKNGHQGAEIMQSVYLSELVLTTRALDPSPQDIVRDTSLLALPSCPLCLEKLDGSATGLSSASNILNEAFISDPNQTRLK